MGSYNSLAQPLKVFNFFSPKSLHPTGEGGGAVKNVLGVSLALFFIG